MANGNQPDWSQPPEQGPPKHGQATGFEQLIPTKNPWALTAYYVGVFSLIPCLGLVLGPTALIFGVLGLQRVKRIPALVGRGHAIAGIVLGSLAIVANIAGILVLFL